MTTYYVRPTNGSDANSGTSFANAWQTMQYAFDNAVAGDTVRFCAEATETTASTIDLDTNSGSQTSCIRFEGYDGVNGTTRAKYTIQAVAAWGGGALISDAGSGTVDYITFQDIIFDANDLASSALSNTSTTAIGWSFLSCEFKQATDDGIICGNTNLGPGMWHFIDCSTNNHGAAGFDTQANGNGACIWTGGSCHNNATNGFEPGEIININKCCIYNNGADGIVLINSGDRSIFTNCTFYNNTGDGIDIPGFAEGVQVIACSFVSNGGYGINDTTAGEMHLVDYNHYHNNTSGTQNTGEMGGYNQTGDPKFVSTTSGSEDFRLLKGSPLIQNGPSSTHIGAKGRKLPTTSGAF